MVGMARWRLESRERSWTMLGAGRGCLGGGGWRGREGKAAWVEDAGPGRAGQVGEGCRWQGKDGEVEIVRWRWRSGKNHRIMCEEWHHPGSMKIYGKTMSLLIGPDTTFIRSDRISIH